MRQAIIKYNNTIAGVLTEEDNGDYVFIYDETYARTYPNQFITFNMPVVQRSYRSKRLFPFFDGLIPEGWLLNIAAESWRINKNDRPTGTKRSSASRTNSRPLMVSFPSTICSITWNGFV